MHLDIILSDLIFVVFLQESNTSWDNWKFYNYYCQYFIKLESF